MTFAVIKTGGKQYKVAANDVLKIEKLDAEAGTIVTFDQVLMVDGEVGAPLVEGALVAAELLETRKQKTVIILKKNRRHNYRRRNGHRQLLSTVRITEILTGGAQPSVKAAGLAQSGASVSEAAPAQSGETTAASAPEATEAKARKASKKAAAETSPNDASSEAVAQVGAQDTATGETAAAKPAKKAAAKKAAPKADQE